MKNKMKNITILLPVYKLEEIDVAMLKNAVASTGEFKDNVIISIIAPKTLKKELEAVTFDGEPDVKYVYNTTESTEFTSQINIGIEACETEWFSILEIDDEYKPIWYKVVQEYVEAYQDVQVFLPVVEDVNEGGNLLGFTNESLWAFGFTANPGLLDIDILLEYQNYQTSGALFKTEAIKNCGNFKDNIKLTFVYEFLLRIIHNGIVVMGVPKIGYRHVNFREGSLFWLYKNNDERKLSEGEAKFWIDSAKKEYYYKNKRDLKYEA
jgi:hypothetical protein